jgi:hypothetical protein
MTATTATTQPQNLVPKVHPATRAVEPDDPMSLFATPVAGDPDVMLQAVVHEYAWMGWDAEQILGLFRDPFYPLLNDLRDALGEDVLRQRIGAIFECAGVYRFRATVREAPEEIEPELVQIGPMRLEESHHGNGL